MKKNLHGFFGFVLVSALLVIGCAGTARAELNVSVNFGAPSQVVLMPQTGVYFVPGASSDIFFYNGYWWSQRGDGWYRANQYNGPWGVVQRSYVPANLYKVPKNYRAVYKNARPINYGQLKKHNKK